MIKQIVAGATLAAFSTLAVAGAASATPIPQAGGDLLPTVSGIVPTDFAGDTGGILSGNAAPVINIDLRCAVPNPDVQYIGGTLFGGNQAACNIAPVT